MTAETQAAEAAYLDPTERPWTLWEHRDGALDFETYRTLREAVEAAQAHEDWGNAYFERIEGPGSVDDIAAMWDAVWAERRAADKARRDARDSQPPVQWVVQVGLPHDVGWSAAVTVSRTIRVAWERDRAAADATAAQWAARVGADRVTVLSAAAAGVRS